MRAPVLVVSAALGLCSAGCGDRLKQGDRVVLVDEHGDTIFVGDMPEHTPANPNIARFQEGGGKVDSEGVSAGTRASVVSDSGDEEPRRVKILLLDPPYQGVTGTVFRGQLRRE